MTHRMEQRQLDPWQSVIETWINRREHVTIEIVLTDCLQKLTGNHSQSDKNRVASCLKALGWERYQQRVGKTKREWRYRRAPVFDGW